MRKRFNVNLGRLCQEFPISEELRAFGSGSWSKNKTGGRQSEAEEWRAAGQQCFVPLSGQARPGLAAHLPHHRSYPCLGNTCTPAHAPATPSPFEVLFWPDFALDSPLQTRHMGLCRARPCLPAPGLAAPSGGKAEGNTSNSSPACPCDGRGWGGGACPA